LLHEFLTTHRDDIIAITREKVARRTAPRPTDWELEHGVPLFLTQLAETLQLELGGAQRPASGDMAHSAARHGAELRRAGFTIAQVVHDYGDVCQAVTEMAIRLELPITNDEFKTLNRCLDEAIAQAVTEYARQREISLSARGTERLGFFAHELRNLLANALLAYEVLKTGRVGVGGSTGSVLGRNLVALRDLIDRSLASVRLEAGLIRREQVGLAHFLEEVEAAASMEALASGCQLVVSRPDPSAAIEVDRQLIAAALANLLQNAFKFSRAGGLVVLRADVAAVPGRAQIEVEDECGGMPPERVAEEMFRPFEQLDGDRSGLGLGLTIARESVEVNGGTIRCRNLPGRGCVFTIDLPLVVPSHADAAVGDQAARGR
jgi:signal transduction histidine kinase